MPEPLPAGLITAQHLYLDDLGSQWGFGRLTDEGIGCMSIFQPPTQLSLVDCWLQAGQLVKIVEYCSSNLVELSLRVQNNLECSSTFECGFLPSHREHIRHPSLLPCYIA